MPPLAQPQSQIARSQAPGMLWVFDRKRRPIGTIWPVFNVNLAWQRNQPSAATFTVAEDAWRPASRYNSTYLDFYNWVEYWDARLPCVWTGVIVQMQGGQITCASTEHMYSRRFTDEYWAGNGTETAGQLAGLLHNMAVARGSFGVVAGAIDTSGPSYFLDPWSWKSISDALADLVTASGGDWWVEKTVYDLLSPPQFRWARSRGKDRSGEVLICGEVADPPTLTKIGSSITTNLLVAGGGVGTELWQRIHMSRIDTQTRRVYGLLQSRVDYDQVIDDTLLEQMAVGYLTQNGTAQKQLGVNVDDRYSAWGTFWLGDTVRAILTRTDFIGYDGNVRVDGIQVDVANAKMGLAVTPV